MVDTPDSRWRKAHPEAKQKSNKAWQKRNPDKYRASLVASRARWILENPQEDKLQHSKWRKANSCKVNASTARRRATKLQASPVWANKRYIELFYEVAKLEEQRLGIKCQVDHIIPLKHPLVCGLHCEFNLQVLTAKQNAEKHNTFIIE